MFLKKNNPSDNIGIGLFGGNAVGIFVRDIQSNSIASGPNGLRCGDQILEVRKYLCPKAFFMIQY